MEHINYYLPSIIPKLRHFQKDTKSTVSLITLKSWISGQLVPSSEESLLKLWEETKKVGKRKNPIVVTC